MIGNVAGGVTVGGEFGDIATVIVTSNRNFALPGIHADWFWYMGQQDPVRLPYGFAEVKRGRHWILAHRVAPLDAEPVK